MSFNPIPKSVIALNTLGATNGASVTGNIDCVGYDYLVLDVYTSTVAAASNRPSTLKLSESDTTDATNFSDIAALVGDGTGGFTIPNWFTNTATQQCVKFCVDLRARKRYLKLTAVPRTTQDVIAIANLMSPEVTPVNASATNTLALVSA